jgi:acyl-CoA synthetase (NDP forming)
VTVRRDARPDLSPALGKLLYPRSIVILGASDNPAKLGGRPVDYLKRFDFPGRILPVNPGREYVQGLPAFREVEEIPGEIDLAFIMLPAGQAADAVRVCGRRGIRAAIVGASGFAETGPEGAALQEELRVAAAEAGVRILGPNCLGFVNAQTRSAPYALNLQPPLLAGPVGVALQSGALASVVLGFAKLHGIGLSTLTSMGNESMMKTVDYIDYLVEDDATKVICLFLEEIGDPDRFAHAARKADAAGKPIVALKRPARSRPWRTPVRWPATTRWSAPRSGSSTSSVWTPLRTCSPPGRCSDTAGHPAGGGWAS